MLIKAPFFVHDTTLFILSLEPHFFAEVYSIFNCLRIGLSSPID